MLRWDVLFFTALLLSLAGGQPSGRVCNCECKPGGVANIVVQQQSAFSCPGETPVRCLQRCCNASQSCFQGECCTPACIDGCGVPDTCGTETCGCPALSQCCPNTEGGARICCTERTICCNTECCEPLTEQCVIGEGGVTSCRVRREQSS